MIEKSGKIRFEYEDVVKISMEIDSDSTLPEIFESFERFLRGASFTIPYNKRIDLVDLDD